MKNLLEIQSELKVPRRRYNEEENYHYRNAEDILEAVKPLLIKRECLLYLSDELVCEGDRHYIQANAIFKSPSGFELTVKGFAREPELLDDMVEGQITGATSSFARKYALCGLFCIDDNRDFDSLERIRTTEEKTEKNQKEKQKTVEPVGTAIKETDKVTAEQINHILELMKATKRSKGSLLAFFNVARSGAGLEDALEIEDLTYAEYKRLLAITRK